MCQVFCADLFLVVLEGVLDDCAHGGILLAELGRHLGMVRVLHHPQQVMVHQHLSTTTHMESHARIDESPSKGQPTHLSWLLARRKVLLLSISIPCTDLH